MGSKGYIIKYYIIVLWKKNINFYKKFILQTKTPNDGGLEQNREL